MSISASLYCISLLRRPGAQPHNEQTQLLWQRLLTTATRQSPYRPVIDCVASGSGFQVHFDLVQIDGTTSKHQTAKMDASQLDTQVQVNLPNKLRILTVGDGDFSSSLALMRAYPSLIQQLVATSLLSDRREVVETYPSASTIIQELDSFDNVEILYQVDATGLHINSDLDRYTFDLVMFHHPHLGYDDDDANNDPVNNHLSKRHECLIYRYMQSASLLLGMNDTTKTNSILPCIHLCVCAGSIEKWNILQSAQRTGLEFAWNSPTAASSPPFALYQQLLTNSQTCSSTKQLVLKHTTKDVEKRIRECQHAKRKGHYLGRYGYRHQPTSPNATKFINAAISNSFHIFLTRGDEL